MHVLTRYKIARQALTAVTGELKITSLPARRVMLRVAAKRLQRIASYCSDKMDEAIRLEILEGAAGLPFFSLAGKGPRAWASIEGDPQFANISPEWRNPKRPMCKIMLGNLYKILSTVSNEGEPQVQGMTAEDILQNTIGGIPLGSRDVNVQFFPSIGKKLQRQILNGTATPDKAPLNVAQDGLKKKVIQLIKTEEAERTRRVRDMTDSESGAGQEGNFDADPAVARAMGKSWLDKNDGGDSDFGMLIIQLIRHQRREGKFIIHFMKKMIPRSLNDWDREVVERFIEHLEKGKPTGQAGILREMGEDPTDKSKKVAIGRAIKKGLTAIASAMQKDKKIQEIVGLYLLTRGQRMAAQKKAAFRTQIIKLAYNKPQHREHLLGLL